MTRARRPTAFVPKAVPELASIRNEWLSANGADSPTDPERTFEMLARVLPTLRRLRERMLTSDESSK